MLSEIQIMCLVDQLVEDAYNAYIVGDVKPLYTIAYRYYRLRAQYGYHKADFIVCQVTRAAVKSVESLRKLTHEDQRESWIHLVKHHFRGIAAHQIASYYEDGGRL